MKPNMLITGATGGVGRSLCHHLGSSFHVIAVARNPGELNELLAELPDAEGHTADLADSDAVEALLDSLLERHAAIPYAIMNAGVNIAGRVEELDPEILETSLAVNATTPFRFFRRLLPRMAENGFGRVVAITSGAPFNCFAGFSSYSASKGALNALTVTAAREYQDHDIRINLMSPGPVRSKMAPQAPMEPSVCHPTVDYLMGLPAGGPTGRFFWLGRELPMFPDLEGVRWLEGEADERFPRVVS